MLKKILTLLMLLSSFYFHEHKAYSSDKNTSISSYAIECYRYDKDYIPCLFEAIRIWKQNIGDLGDVSYVTIYSNTGRSQQFDLNLLWALVLDGMQPGDLDLFVGAACINTALDATQHTDTLLCSSTRLAKLYNEFQWEEVSQIRVAESPDLSDGPKKRLAAAAILVKSIGSQSSCQDGALRECRTLIQATNAFAQMLGAQDVRNASRLCSSIMQVVGRSFATDKFMTKLAAECSLAIASTQPIDSAPDQSILPVLDQAYLFSEGSGGSAGLTATIGTKILTSLASAVLNGPSNEGYLDDIRRRSAVAASRLLPILNAVEGRDERLNFYDGAYEALEQIGATDWVLRYAATRASFIKSSDFETSVGLIRNADFAYFLSQQPGRVPQAAELARSLEDSLMNLPESTKSLAKAIYDVAFVRWAATPKDKVCVAIQEATLIEKMLTRADSIAKSQPLTASMFSSPIENMLKEVEDYGPQIEASSIIAPDSLKSCNPIEAKVKEIRDGVARLEASTPMVLDVDWLGAVSDRLHQIDGLLQVVQNRGSSAQVEELKTEVCILLERLLTLHDGAHQNNRSSVQDVVKDALNILYRNSEAAAAEHYARLYLSSLNESATLAQRADFDGLIIQFESQDIVSPADSVDALKRLLNLAIKQHDAIRAFRIFHLTKTFQIDRRFETEFIDQVASFADLASFAGEQAQFSVIGQDEFRAKMLNQRLSRMTEGELRLFLRDFDFNKEKRFISPAISSLLRFPRARLEKILIPRLDNASARSEAAMAFAYEKKFAFAEQTSGGGSEDTFKINLLELSDAKSERAAALKLHKIRELIDNTPDADQKRQYLRSVVSQFLGKRVCSLFEQDAGKNSEILESGASDYDLRNIMTMFARCGNVEKAQEVAGMSQAPNMRAAIRARLYEILIDTGDTDTAETLASAAIEDLKQTKVVSRIHASWPLLDILLKTKGPAAAERAAKEIFLGTSVVGKNVDPLPKYWTSEIQRAIGANEAEIAKYQAQNGDLKSATLTLRTSGLEPTEVALAASQIVIDLYKPGPATTLALPPGMIDLVKLAPGNKNYSEDGDVRAKALFMAGERTEALKLADALVEPEQRVRAYCALADILKPNEDGALLRQLFDSARENAHRIERRKSRAWAFTDISECFWGKDPRFSDTFTQAAIFAGAPSPSSVTLTALAREIVAINVTPSLNNEDSRTILSALALTAETLEKLQLYPQLKEAIYAIRTKAYLLNKDDSAYKYLELTPSETIAKSDGGDDFSTFEALSKRDPVQALKVAADVGATPQNLPIFRLSIALSRKMLLSSLQASTIEHYGEPSSEALDATVAEHYLTALYMAEKEQSDPALAREYAKEAFEVVANASEGAFASSMVRAYLRRQLGASVAENRNRKAEDWPRMRELLFTKLSDVSGPGDQLPEIVAKADGVMASQDEMEIDRPLKKEIQKVISGSGDAAAEVQTSLRSEQALIAYRVYSDRVFAVLLTKQDAMIFDLSTNNDLDAGVISELAERVSSSVASSSEALESPLASASAFNFDFESSYKIYARVLSPILAKIHEQSDLIIIPDGSLKKVPFSVLITKSTKNTREAPVRAYQLAPWLSKDFVISELPSFASWQAANIDKNIIPDNSFLGVGDPVLSKSNGVEGDCTTVQSLTAKGELFPSSVFDADKSGLIDEIADPQQILQYPSLPVTGCELRNMASLFPQRTLLTETAANEAAVEALNSSGDLAKYSVIAFSTHATGGGDAQFHDPGLLLTPPAQATILDDGFLSASEISGLSLNANLVILSACSTATRGATNDDQFSGLANAFMTAGARNLLVSYWDVDSKASKDLTTGLIQRIRSNHMNYAKALQQSMLAELAAATSPRQAFPGYWAPFVLLGH